jgi:D-erythro-7,8-dihydroneopterin triphosphate epimerase
MTKILDTLTIHELTARTFVGFNDWEREKKQDVRITIRLHADLRRACVTDKVDDTVDYKQIKTLVLNLVENNRFDLIEKMAEDIARTCLETPLVEEVDVTVNKGSALRFAKSVEVTIHRSIHDE